MTVAERCVFIKGDTIDGKYRILKCLGEGSFGDVYHVADPGGEQFAIKILKLWSIPPEAGDNLRKRFVMEFETGKITSDYLVHTISYGEIKGNPYILMEFCPSGDLRHYLTEHKNNADYFQIAKEILSGLSVLHRNGKVHRDLKPENVLVKKSGIAALTDFGISGDRNKRMTERGIMGKPLQIFGTYPYMPPEQVNPPRGGLATVLPTTDIFSFGVMMYELLVGKLPYGELTEATIVDYLRNAREGKWDRASLKHIPDGVVWDKIISGCLEPDFRCRTQTALAVMSELPSEYHRTEDSHQGRDIGHGEIVLRIMQGEEYGRIYHIEKMLSGGYLLTIGREAPDVNNLLSIKEVNSRYISRHHCTLEKNPETGIWYLRDGQWTSSGWKASLNGTYINSEVADSFGKAIHAGDIISIGDVKLRVEKLLKNN